VAKVEFDDDVYNFKCVSQEEKLLRIRLWDFLGGTRGAAAKLN